MGKTKEDLERDLLIAQIQKTEVDTKKAKEELCALQRHPLKDAKVLGSIVTAVLTLIVTSSGWYSALQQQATDEQSFNQSISSYVSSIQEAGQVDSKARIRINFRGSLTREVVTELQEQLNRKGYVALPPYRTEAVEQSVVRYRNPSNLKFAEEIAVIANRFFADKGCPLAKNLEARAEESSSITPDEAIDLAVYHKCR